jgi:AmiR/NasT family two-component response regulator
MEIAWFANDGIDLVDKLCFNKKNGVDVVLLDAEMPPLSWQETSEIVASINPAVVMVLLAKAPINPATLHAARILDVILKPIAPRELGPRLLVSLTKMTDSSATRKDIK